VIVERQHNCDAERGNRSRQPKPKPRPDA
jgi:hypothetical protein